MAGIEPNGLALLMFGTTFAACCLGFFTIIGMFPLHARPQSLSGAPGIALVAINAVLLILLLLSVVSFAHETLRWTSVVVFGGLIFLFVPSVFQAIPNKWRDSRGGLAILGVVQFTALAALLSPLQIFSAL
ncbi:hypothetical protein [Bradyrhizobium canariense]|uniref:Major facilitator superfamily (MFS) profile domain-containing protein n=1 Tax=Bradyrhizobium canariense TaxID=255045 RepID=A0A1H1UK44_9BRAD|nr:hypothetical protein [Bradyrhizobium canariense]SDS72681.1 hypothetical protein SAMN05444158_2986 [Bradyrhizobium canariense]